MMKLQVQRIESVEIAAPRSLVHLSDEFSQLRQLPVLDNGSKRHTGQPHESGADVIKFLSFAVAQAANKNAFVYDTFDESALLETAACLSDRAAAHAELGGEHVLVKPVSGL